MLGERCSPTDMFGGAIAPPAPPPLNKFSIWPTETRDYQVGDIVRLREEPTAPTKWPLVKVIKVHPGQDGKVCVVTVRIAKGTCVRPAVKLVPLIQEHE